METLGNVHCEVGPKRNNHIQVTESGHVYSSLFMPCPTPTPPMNTYQNDVKRSFFYAISHSAHQSQWNVLGF